MSDHGGLFEVIEVGGQQRFHRRELRLFLVKVSREKFVQNPAHVLAIKKARRFPYLGVSTLQERLNQPFLILARNVAEGPGRVRIQKRSRLQFDLRWRHAMTLSSRS